MGFMTMPEIVYSGCDTTFTYDNAIELFDQDLEGSNNGRTLLSPQNYFTFQNDYQNGNQTLISGKFGLDGDQSYCLYNYAQQQAAYSRYQAYGNMLTQGVESSLKDLETHFPINLAARTIAYLNNVGGSYPSVTPC